MVNAEKSVADPLLLALLRMLPKTLLSRWIGCMGRIPLPFPLNWLVVLAYAALFHVDLSEAEFAPSRYSTLNAFFTRRLKVGLRPLDPDARSFLSPVDGSVVETGRITHGSLLQAKGRRYSLRDLLVEPGRATDFLEGSFCTLYLSPSNYHRIHAPVDGSVDSLRYVPGRLFPVNPFSVSRVENLFVINERIIIYLKTGLGRVALVLVGATCVGKIRILFDEVRTQLFRRGPFQRTYKPEIALTRGSEIGCFELGSTVILLFEKERVSLTVAKGNRVRVGERIGYKT